jgi:hypothetical protein
MEQDNCIWSYNTLNQSKRQVGQLPELLEPVTGSVGHAYHTTRTTEVVRDPYIVTRDGYHLVISSFSGKPLLHIQTPMKSSEIEVRTIVVTVAVVVDTM